MKKIYYIVIFLLLCLSACEKEQTYDLSGGPILFSQEISTRGNSLSSLDGHSFGVRGYIYTGEWNAVASTTKPDAKWKNVKVSCSDGGICQYQNVQNWQKEKNYSFFAFHPHTSDCKKADGTSMIQWSDNNKTGVPYFDYTMERDVLADTSYHHDVMYAYRLDVNENNCTTVALSFRHCLSAIQLVIMNLNAADLKVNDLRLELKDVKNKSLRQTFNEQPATYTPFYPNDPNLGETVVFPYIDQSRNEAPVMVPSTLNGAYYDVCKQVCHGNHLLLIPQFGAQKGIHARIYITLNDKSEPERDPVDGEPGICCDFPMLELLPGFRYVLALSCSGEKLTASFVSSDQWESVEDDIVFE